MSQRHVAKNTIGYLDATDWMQFRDSLFDPADRPKLVVAIARKMPRILEYLNGRKEAACPVVTERALPWLDTRGGEEGCIVFCDDVLNVGSTLSHYVQYAQKIGLKQIRAKVYARREAKRRLHEASPLAELGISVRHSFDEKSYWRFETALPQELLKIGKPYDVDFPIVSVPLQAEQAARSPEEWQEILAQRFCSVHNLTTPSQRDAGVSSISIIEPLDLNERELVPLAGDVAPILKVRLYLSQRDQLARVVPMCVLGVPVSVIEDGAGPFQGDLNEVFLAFSRRARRGSPFDFEPLFNLVTYLASFEYGRGFLRHLSPDLFGGSEIEASLTENDLQLVFGPGVATELCGVLQQRLRAPGPGWELRNLVPRYSATIRPVKPDLSDVVSDRLMQEGYSGATPAQVFRQVMRILDDLSRANEPPEDTYPEYARLRNGLPLVDLWLVAKQVCGMQESLSFEQASFLLDYYVDVGVVVPVVEEIRGTYCRTYRRGEADPVEFAELAHSLLMVHADIFPDTPLNLTGFTKILSALAVYHPGKLPLVPVFERRGRVPYIVSSDEAVRQAEEAVDFLRRKQVIRIDPPARDGESGQLTLLRGLSE